MWVLKRNVAGREFCVKNIQTQIQMKTGYVLIHESSKIKDIWSGLQILSLPETSSLRSSPHLGERFQVTRVKVPSA
jgi:hypothetical protein